jgi:high-affinity nickel-transport protein
VRTKHTDDNTNDNDNDNDQQLNMDEAKHPLIRRMRAKATSYHSQIPYLRKLPGSALAIVLFLVLVNLLVWTACAIVLHFHTSLVSTAVLAYTLGLRHALDADHIAAIDLCTRRLVASGQRPVTVGTFFSLGHSTIVVVTSIVVAASSAAISDQFDAFGDVGGIIGSSVSSAFLIILGSMNAYILYKLTRTLRATIRSPIGHENTTSTTSTTNLFPANGGCMTALLHKLFRLIDAPWKMYPLGVLFGLGFDTSSEVALLGISAIQASHGTSIWLILIFPVLFTAGMCLLDTADGAAMMSLYSSARLASDTIAVLYYQCVLTALTVVVALVIGTLQLLTMVLSVRPGLGGPFWRGVEVAGEKYDVIGGAVCGAFVVFGGLAVVGYGPWRRRVDRWRAVHAPAVEDEAYADDGIDGEASSNAAQSSPENGKAGVVVHVAETDGEAGGSRS